MKKEADQAGFKGTRTGPIEGSGERNIFKMQEVNVHDEFVLFGT